MLGLWKQKHTNKQTNKTDKDTHTDTDDNVLLHFLIAPSGGGRYLGSVEAGCRCCSRSLVYVYRKPPHMLRERKMSALPVMGVWKRSHLSDGRE